MTCKSLYIAVDGIIGAGKTTLINRLSKDSILNKQYNIKVIHEPVDIWKDIKLINKPSIIKKTINLLGKFYNDPTKYAFLFQIVVMFSRLKIFKEIEKQNKQTNKKTLYIFDRSLISTKFFTQVLYEQKTIDDIEYYTFLCIFNDYLKYIPKMTFKIYYNIINILLFLFI